MRAAEVAQTQQSSQSAFEGTDLVVGECLACSPPSRRLPKAFDLLISKQIVGLIWCGWTSYSRKTSLLYLFVAKQLSSQKQVFLVLGRESDTKCNTIRTLDLRSRSKVLRHSSSPKAPRENSQRENESQRLNGFPSHLPAKTIFYDRLQVNNPGKSFLLLQSLRSNESI